MSLILIFVNCKYCSITQAADQAVTFASDQISTLNGDSMRRLSAAGLPNDQLGIRVDQLIYSKFHLHLTGN